jgi:primosomal protein N' (replication factor Y) (superfamily II helicase)
VDKLPTSKPSICRVALDTPLRRTFDYRIEADRAAPPLGSRVSVPFGRRQLVGVAISLESESEVDESKLKSISRTLDPEPTFDAPLLKLLRWATEYYHHPIGEVIAAALPKLLREGAPLVSQTEYWAATDAGIAALAAGEPKRAPKRRELLERLVAAGTRGLDVVELNEQLPGWREAAKALAKQEWLISGSRDIFFEPSKPVIAENSTSTDIRPELSAQQRQVLEAMQSSGVTRYHAWLLHGVTGSGKTEVYLRLAEQQLQAGRRVLVLVPEIGLTPQLVGRFARRFPQTPLAVLHSGLTDSERLTAWRAAHRGHAQLVIGTRSAVFAPIPSLGIIIVDEEHDSSFKQQEGGFRYSARDLALVRAHLLDIPIVLGSATPSLESLHNAASGRLTRLSLPDRAASASPPTLRLVDLRQERVHAGLSTTAVSAIQRHLAADGQVLVYINRRGYAPTLACTACGWVAPCQSCDARMTVYRQAARLRCHHCGADRDLPRQCPQCGYAVKTVGQGTERIEESLAETFPGVGIARLDRDVVRRSDELEAVVARMSGGEAKILVGTQMVAKGHDFPSLTLVVVLNADQGLFSTDFRAAERLAQTIVQVAGRAGRASRPGEVLIQTEYPEHPLLSGLLTGGYDAFASAALEERRSAAWPPFSRLAALRASATEAETAIQFLEAARRATRTLNTGAVRLLGPAPAAMARRADRHHAQLLLESADRGALHRLLDQWLPAVEALPEARRVRWALDVDPLELF